MPSAPDDEWSSNFFCQSTKAPQRFPRANNHRRCSNAQCSVAEAAPALAQSYSPSGVTPWAPMHFDFTLPSAFPPSWDRRTP